MRLFVDMDGVLADFDRGYGERFGARPSKADDNVDWNIVRHTPGFYRDLPPMSDFDVLWAGIEHLNPIVLTGVPSSVPEAIDNKREWIVKNIGTHVPMIGCKSKDKCLHGLPGDVLIDDWEKYRHFWIGMGGVWITHLSAKQTLQLLSHFTQA
jgi:5'(3')-deoxyribonucleotidase